VDDDMGAFDFCDAAANGVMDIYFVDVDGSLSTDSPSQFGTVISDDEVMGRLADPSKGCRRYADRCFRYCPGLCLRTIRYETDPMIPVSVELRICETVRRTCFSYNGIEEAEMDNLGNRRRYFVAHLPPGRYEAEFVDYKGARVWPSYADVHYERSFCPTTPDFQVQLLRPNDSSTCRELIANGDFKASRTEPLYWLYRPDAGIKLQPGRGMNGTPALVTAFNVRTTVGQYLDNRCFDLMKGRTYKVKANLRFATRRGESLDCYNGKSCGFIGINTRNGGYVSVGRVVDAPMVKGFYAFEGDLVLDGVFGVNDQVFFSIYSVQPNTMLIVDRVSIYLP
jgi:hypothetical protein